MTQISSERPIALVTGASRKIYQLLGEDESQTYYQMSTQLGYDIARFYG